MILILFFYDDGYTYMSEMQMTFLFQEACNDLIVPS